MAEYSYRRDHWDEQDFAYADHDQFMMLAEEAYKDHSNKDDILEKCRKRLNGGFHWNGIYVCRINKVES